MTPQGAPPKPAPAPVSVPSSIDGKPATATHFALQTNSSKPTPVQPVAIADVKWDAPKVAVQAKNPGGEKAVVTYVGDGDGAILKRGDGSELTCRIDTIDAPEVAHPKYNKPGQAYGEEARRTLQSLIQNKEVTVTVTRPSDSGKYGRSYCKIEVEGVGVDQKMLQAGAAWLYRRYSNDPGLAAAEAEAKSAKRGLWSDPNAENPETFRHKNKL